ncbi:MAG: 4Fe-4S dicluster domain-containing protein [Lachnospiraceae bacterium]|nr:4Fe-4S dicluster domain-containing protein [Lachnospiraceae bacterium]
MARYGFAVDLQACIGCHTCSVACKNANNLPNDMWWLNVLTVGGEAMDTSEGTYPNTSLSYVPLQCQHCANPACVAACPSGASYQREDGIVIVDHNKCTGCRTCMTVCPYSEVRQYNSKEPEYHIEFAMGASDAPIHKYNTVEKCNMCASRIDRGEEPYCVEVCPARARIFGDLDDPNSDVSKAIAARETMRLLEEKQTDPSIYYLV